MKNRFLIAFCAMFMTFHASSQIAVYKAKQLQAIDSIKLVSDWIKSITKDSAFVGVTDRDIPSALSVKKYVSGSLFGLVPNTRTINSYPLSANITLNKADVGLANVDNTSDANKPVSTAQAASIATKQATLVSGSNIKTVNSTSLLGSGDLSVSALLGFTPENLANKNVNNGYAGIDAGGKIPVSLLPSTIMIYKGTWNAATNSPSLSDGTGTSGWIYIVSTGGTVNTGSGSITYAAGDYAIHNGSTWQRSVGTNNVSSVNGQQGVVILTSSNIAEGSNLYYTDARARSSISLTNTGSSGAATYSSGTINIPNYTLAGLGGVSLSGSYADPSWITSLNYSKITSRPTALSSFTNDLGNYGSFLTSETDPSVYAWAKASTKPSYSWSEITSRPTALSSFTNDLGNYGSFLTSETDPSVYAWAKASTKPSYSWSEITSRPTALSSFTNDLGNYGSFLTSETDPSVYAWAKASTKPSYSWSEITGTVPTWNQNTTGTASNISSYTINQNLGTGNSPTFYDITASNNLSGKNLVLNTGSGSIVPYISGNGGLRLKDSNSSNEVALGIPSSSELVLGASFTAKHYSSNSFVSISAGAGAGTGATVGVEGNDVGMKITVTVGSSPAASSTIVTITYGTPYDTPPSLVFSPGNGNAAAMNGARAIYIDNGASTTDFTLVSGTTPITTTLTFVWYVHVIDAKTAL